ncbi:sel1 repeat family protein, partial [Escherichia coli]|uniref:tetratricopeptide repeat protein n=1 Tax=Escherichia coli TaxID=562 RepID=UPI001E476A19
AKGWFEKAAKRGEPYSQSKIGIMYLTGQGVKQDYVQARKWFEKAAIQGNATALGKLSVMYYQGLGVKQDLSKSKFFAGELCDKGDQKGCDLYRRFNEDGVP